MTQNRRITMSEGLFMAIVRFHHLPPLFKSSYNQVSDLLCQILALILQCVELTFFFFVFLTILSSACTLMLNLLFTFSFDALLYIDLALGHLPVTLMLPSNSWHSGSHLWMKDVHLFSDHRWVWVKRQVLSLYLFVSPNSVLSILGTKLLFADWNNIL